MLFSSAILINNTLFSIFSCLAGCGVGHLVQIEHIKKLSLIQKDQWTFLGNFIVQRNLKELFDGDYGMIPRRSSFNLISTQLVWR